MAIVMAVSMSINVFAAGSAKQLYVKDIKFLYAEDYEEAKSLVPEGYIIMDTDLNQGTEVVFDVPNVYMIYSTTENPDEAITDIKAMNMNGGFSYSDYEEQMEDISDDIKAISMEIKAAVLQFRKNYERGTYGAKAAYTTLSAFTVDEMGMSLAEYFVHGNIPDDFYLKFFLNVHKDILSAVLAALAIGVQGKEGSTWLDRMTSIEDPEAVSDSLLWDKASALTPHFYSFADTYASIDLDVFKKGDTMPPITTTDENGKIEDIISPEDSTEEGSDENTSEEGMEIFYVIAVETLKTYSFQNGKTFSEWFVDEMYMEEYLYPLVSVLNDAEYAMMHLCGPLHMILSTAMSAEVYDDYVTRVTEVIEEAGTCSVWAGVNTELFRSSIGITDEANRVLAETKAEQELNNDGDSGLDGTIRVAGLVLSAGAIALGIGLVATKVFGTTLGLSLTVTGKCLWGITTSIIGSIMGVLSLVTGIVLIVAAIVIALVYLVTWLKDLYEEYHPELTEIPEYMYELVKDSSENQQFVLYEAARSQDGTPADVNAFEGREWHAIYFSKDKAAGEPIEADFKIKIGDGRVGDGYAGLCNFGQINSVNLNKYAFDDEVGGIFISYRQEKQVGEYAKGKYLSDMRIFSEESPEKTKLEIRNKGYSIYDINLTPGTDTYTYIGYKTSNKKDEALTDIRLAYNYEGDKYYVGGGSLTYAPSGDVGPLTLFTTRISTFGSPILSEFVVQSNRNAPEGYEPVNFFSGGPAVSLHMDYSVNEEVYSFIEDRKTFLFFLPSETYTSGPEYIGGFTTVYDAIHSNYPQYSNGKGSVAEAVEKLGYTSILNMTGDADSEGAVVYSLTHNPYRAIYGISMQSNGIDGDDSDTKRQFFAETMQYDGAGYSIAMQYEVQPDLFNKEIRIKGNHSPLNKSTDHRLYVRGVAYGGEPLTLDDIAVSDNPTAREGFIGVTTPYADSDAALNISSAYNRTVNYLYGLGSTVEERNCRMSAAYVFVRGEKYVEGTYLTNVFVTSKEDILGDMNADCSDLDASYLYNSLGTFGAHSCIAVNLNLEETDNVTYLGYTKNPIIDTNPKDLEARTLEKITDLMLYYMPETDDDPPNTVVKDGARYKLVSDINLFCEEDGTEEICDRVYLYVTSNPIKGTPIIDITIDNNPILNGWETVRTQNNKALNQEMDDYWGDMWFIHVRRTERQPQYVSEIAVGWGSEEEAMAMLVSAGCEYFIDKDLNDNVGAHSDYVYLGYKRTDDFSQAIKDIRTTHDHDVPSFKINETTYYKVEGNLNSYTWVWSDDIFFYYTKEGNTPITSIYISEKPVDYWTSDTSTTTALNQHDGLSDLNDGAGGDYLYLIQTKMRHKENVGLFARIFNFNGNSSMIGEGSIIAIIALTGVAAVAIIWVALYQKKRRVDVIANSEEKGNDGK